MASKLFWVLSKSRPLSASLAPNSITTRTGRTWFSKAGNRDLPPAVVSPLILALTTCTSPRSFCNCAAIKATHPLPRWIPYSALSESPKTKILATGALPGAGAEPGGGTWFIEFCPRGGRGRVVTTSPSNPAPLEEITCLCAKADACNSPATAVHIPPKVK